MPVSVRVKGEEGLASSNPLAKKAEQLFFSRGGVRATVEDVSSFLSQLDIPPSPRIIEGYIKQHKKRGGKSSAGVNNSLLPFENCVLIASVTKRETNKRNRLGDDGSYFKDAWLAAGGAEDFSGRVPLHDLCLVVHGCGLPVDALDGLHKNEEKSGVMSNTSFSGNGSFAGEASMNNASFASGPSSPTTGSVSYPELIASVSIDTDLIEVVSTHSTEAEIKHKMGEIMCSESVKTSWRTVKALMAFKEVLRRLRDRKRNLANFSPVVNSDSDDEPSTMLRSKPSFRRGSTMVRSKSGIFADKEMPGPPRKASLITGSTMSRKQTSKASVKSSGAAMASAHSYSSASLAGGVGAKSTTSSSSLGGTAGNEDRGGGGGAPKTLGDQLHQLVQSHRRAPKVPQNLCAMSDLDSNFDKIAAGFDAEGKQKRRKEEQERVLKLDRSHPHRAGLDLVRLYATNPVLPPLKKEKKLVTSFGSSRTPEPGLHSPEAVRERKAKEREEAADPSASPRSRSVSLTPSPLFRQLSMRSKEVELSPVHRRKRTVGIQVHPDTSPAEGSPQRRRRSVATVST